MVRPKTSLKITGTTRLLSAPEFQGLAEMPREVEWFKNIRNASTKRAYENAIKDFMLFTGIKRPEEFRLVTRACHRLARRPWRKNWRPEPNRHEHTAPAGGVVVAVSVSLR
jgi:hypothetical protein